MLEALKDVLGTVDAVVVSKELESSAPADARAILAGAGIRDEYLFPTPAILIDEPRLVGYYRLL